MKQTPSTTIQKEAKFTIPVVKKMRDYSKEPFFLQKLEKAKAFLQKHGLPKGLDGKAGRGI